MTSVYVCKWKFVKNEVGDIERTIRSRRVLRGFMGLEAFDVEMSSGRARRSIQRLLASAAARRKQFIIASLDIDVAFLRGLTRQELAEGTGGMERAACFALPPGPASVLGSLPGFEHYDES
eukprot:1538689-Pyramimonas_sp.AAC.2